VKTCIACKKDLVEAEFDKDMRRPDGKMTRCRPCRRAWCERGQQTRTAESVGGQRRAGQRKVKDFYHRLRQEDFRFSKHQQVRDYDLGRLHTGGESGVAPLIWRPEWDADDYTENIGGVKVKYRPRYIIDQDNTVTRSLHEGEP
jgi:hypothetical protein